MALISGQPMRPRRSPSGPDRVRLLLGGAASNDTRQILVTGSNPLLAADTGTDSTAMNRRTTARQANGLAQIVGLAIGAPEFQRR